MAARIACVRDLKHEVVWVGYRLGVIVVNEPETNRDIIRSKSGHGMKN